MATPKFSTFIVAMILVSALVTIMGLLMSNLASNYDVSYGDNESPVIISKLDELDNLTRSSRAQVYPDADENAGFVSNTLDVLGNLFQNGYTAIKAVGKSFDTFQSMFDVGIQRLNLGSTESVIRVAVISMVLITIVVGIGISVLVKREM